jgi:lysozyme
MRTVREEEGFVPVAYPDSKGFLTIGYGTLIDPRKPGAGLTQEEAEYLAINRLDRARRAAQAFSWYASLSEVRQEIITLMVFQMGANGVRQFLRMGRALSQGDFKQAAAEMRDSKWARDDSPARAERMAQAMERGVWR